MNNIVFFIITIIRKSLICIRNIIMPLYKFCYICFSRFGITVVPILTFHCFVQDEIKKNNEQIKKNKWYASIDVFEEQIKWLVEHKYVFIDMDMIENWLLNKKELPDKPIFLTFDDGVKSQLDLVVPILKKYNAQGCCFVIGKRWLNKQEVMPLKSKEDNYDFFDKEYYNKNSDNLKYMKVYSHTYNFHYKKNKIPAIYFMKKSDIESDCDIMLKNGFNYAALPYGAYGTNTALYFSKYYKLAFAFDKIGFPYIIKNSNIFKLNRIAIDGNYTVKTLKKYLY